MTAMPYFRLLYLAGGDSPAKEQMPCFKPSEKSRKGDFGTISAENIIWLNQKWLAEKLRNHHVALPTLANNHDPLAITISVWDASIPKDKIVQFNTLIRSSSGQAKHSSAPRRKEGNGLNSKGRWKLLSHEHRRRFWTDEESRSVTYGRSYRPLLAL